MPNYIVMIPSGTAGAAVRSPAYATVDDALKGARFMLRNGATSAWIVDSEGSILLPAEQVRSRLGSIEEPHHSLTEGKRADTHKFEPILPS